MKQINVVTALIFNNGKMLVFRKNNKSKYLPLHLKFFGDKIKTNENKGKKVLIRKLKEKLNVIVGVKEIIY